MPKEEPSGINVSINILLDIVTMMLLDLRIMLPQMIGYDKDFESNVF